MWVGGGEGLSPEKKQISVSYTDNFIDFFSKCIIFLYFHSLGVNLIAIRCLKDPKKLELDRHTFAVMVKYTIA